MRKSTSSVCPSRLARVIRHWRDVNALLPGGRTSRAAQRNNRGGVLRTVRRSTNSASLTLPVCVTDRRASGSLGNASSGVFVISRNGEPQLAAGAVFERPNAHGGPEGNSGDIRRGRDRVSWGTFAGGIAPERSTGTSTTGCHVAVLKGAQQGTRDFLS